MGLSSRCYPVRISGPVMSKQTAQVMLGRSLRAYLSASSCLPIVYQVDQKSQVAYLLVIAVAVEPRNVHACIKHLLDGCHVVARRAQSAHDLGLPELNPHRLEDVVEVHSVSTEALRLDVVNLGTLEFFNVWKT